MKAFIAPAALIGLLLAAPIAALSQSSTKAPQTVLPEYQIEEIGAPYEPGEPLLPFVYNGYMYVFSALRRQPAWRIFIGGDLVNPFAVDGGKIFVYDIYNRMIGIDAARRRILWTTDIKNEIRGRPCVYKHYVLVSTQKGSLFILSDESGQILFEHPGEGHQAAEIVGGVAVFRNLAVVPYKNGRIAAFDMDTKMEAWTFDTGGVVGVPPVVSGDIVYVGAWNETFYAIDARTGALRWSSRVGDNVSRDFLVFDDTIILFFSKGQVLGLDQETGAIRWTKYLERLEFNFNYFPGRGKFFLFTPEMTALDASSGEVLYRYGERANLAYREMLFENMIAGERVLSDEERSALLTKVYFTVKSYPSMPPLAADGSFVYFITEDSHFYIYDLEKDFFTLKYKLGQG